MSKDLATPSSIKETLRLYWGATAGRRRGLGSAFVASCVYGLFLDVLIPLVIGRLVDQIIKDPHNNGHLNVLFGQLIGYSLIIFVSARTVFWFRNRFMADMERDLNMLVFDAYERQEYDFYANNFVGSLVARAGRFVTTFKQLHDVALFSFVDLIFQLGGPIVVLGSRAPSLALVFVAATTLMVVVVKFSGSRKQQMLYKNAAASSAVTASLADFLTNILAVKVFARQSQERQNFYKSATSKRDTYFALAKRTDFVRAQRSVVSQGFQVAATAILIILAGQGHISIGTIVVAQIFMVQLGATLWNINNIAEKLEEALADATEMTEVILRSPKLTDALMPMPLEADKGEVRLRDVRFDYTDKQSSSALFEKINLVISPGQKVGLVGPSGGGKTTITKLLLRFMDVQSGAVEIDGQDIRLVRQEDLRTAIAYVPQEPLLFHRSIRENIAYGDPSSSQEQIVEAAKLAHADEFISKLPKGYDTLVGERGVKLSGGEKQRVAIARAMLKKSPIVVLDEATSALDSRSEKAIVGALDNLMKGRTTLVIAHRLSTIRKLDRILVLKDGKIVEDGPHEKLLKQKGLYAELWQHQSGEFIGE